MPIAAGFGLPIVAFLPCAFQRFCLLYPSRPNGSKSNQMRNSFGPSLLRVDLAFFSVDYVLFYRDVSRDKEKRNGEDGWWAINKFGPIKIT